LFGGREERGGKRGFDFCLVFFQVQGVSGNMNTDK